VTIRNRFVMSGIWVILLPLIAVIITAAILLTWFFVSDPVRTGYLFDLEKVAKDPIFPKLTIIWAVVSVIIVIICCSAVVFHLSGTLLRPLRELKQAADRIRTGDLNFEIMTSKYQELNELCTAFESMRKRLKEMELIQKEYERERSLLIANISHDLRTPITSIKGYAQGIMDGVADTPEKRVRYITTIYHKAETLEELANSMQEFSQYEMHRIHYDFLTMDVTAFLRSFAEEYLLDLEADGVTLEYRVPDKKHMVIMDAAKMRRVLSNVIGNAVKYKKKDSAVIQISMESMHGGVCITISDNGMGINEVDIRNVFDSHFRGDPSRTSQVKGQGLGLSISKQIVESHKGKIWITSKEDVGTTVYIYLPEA